MWKPLLAKRLGDVGLISRGPDLAGKLPRYAEFKLAQSCREVACVNLVSPCGGPAMARYDVKEKTFTLEISI